MTRLVVVYFSGTGNTEYVAKRLYNLLHYDTKSIFSIEDSTSFHEVIGGADDVLVAYPICGGNIPIIMREFLRRYRVEMYGKNLITIVTEAGFSGDGGALAYRYIASDKVHYKASYHVIMPTNVSFGKLFVIKNGKAIAPRIAKANRKIYSIAHDINSGKMKRVGSSKLSYILGYHLQRKYFDRIEGDLIKRFSVDADRCIHCKKCIRICPMHNISYRDERIVGNGNCTLCYRCVHACPTNAITIIKRENVQYKGVQGGYRQG